MTSKIVLDAEAFKALSSDTRLQILKALDARPLTVSEMGRVLDLNKATVFEHLKQLAQAELVKKTDEGRKWVYYKLTWKGRNVVHPENVQFMLMLATSALSLGGVVALAANLARLHLFGGDEAASGEPETAPFAPTADEQADTEAGAGADQMRATAPDGDGEAMASGDSFWEDPQVWVLALLFIVVAVSATLAIRQWMARRRARSAMRERLAATAAAPDASA